MWVVRTVGGMPLNIPISRHQGCCSLTIPQCIGQFSTASSSFPNINGVSLKGQRLDGLISFCTKENMRILLF